MFSLLLLVLVCVSLGVIFQNQGLLGSITLVLGAGEGVGWGLYHRPERMVTLQLLGLV